MQSITLLEDVSVQVIRKRDSIKKIHEFYCRIRGRHTQDPEDDTKGLMNNLGVRTDLGTGNDMWLYQKCMKCSHAKVISFRHSRQLKRCDSCYGT